MIYVGVPNNAKKTELVKRDPVRTIYVDPCNLAWDCDRHVKFLREYLRRPEETYGAWMMQTEYAGYLLSSGRSAGDVQVKCERFVRFLQHIRGDGWESVWSTVTEDGLRLDGSHRAAIAVVTDEYSVPVAVVPYERSDEEWRKAMREIRDCKIQEVANRE